MQNQNLEDLTMRLNALGQMKRELTGDLDTQIAALTEEKQRREAPIEAEIIMLRADLQAVMLAQQMPQLKTQIFTFSVYPQQKWDTKGLTTFAIERPEILQFRQETIQTRLLWR